MQKNSTDDANEEACPSAIEVTRAVLVTFGGPALVSAAALGSILACGYAIGRLRRPRRSALFGVCSLVAYEALAAPWMRSWGSTPAERARPLPADELVPGPAIEVNHGVTVAASAEEVWPWLAQIGQDRGGFYSYERLENLAGCQMRNADRIHPEWQDREVGEGVMLHPAAPAVPVTVFEPGHAIGLEGWGVFAVEPAGERFCRLIARGRIPRGGTSVFYRTLLELPHFIMQREMLLGIKRRAEAAAFGPGTAAG
jgi:hypothetical protein